MRNLQVPLFTATIFLSAFLLFVFQPMVGKFLLPNLGGTSSVWNTAMLFFQLLLLGGYIYAHLISKIRDTRIQAITHIFLMAVAGLTLPLALPDHLGSDVSSNPVLWQLKAMAGMAALPFFMISASAPLLQAWFARTGHKHADNPYFLYSASNIGSMLALLSYPFVTEPLFGLHQQSTLWAVGYALLAGFFILCATWPKFPSATAAVKIDDAQAETVHWKRRCLWIFLAFCPSSLMLGFTTFITTDIASVPLFWVIPLALYLSTFILAFAGRQLIKIETTRNLQGILMLLLVLFATSKIPIEGQWLAIAFHALLFFITALMCHQELVATKPGVSRLTEFYLFISVGGALGGIFNSLLAPILFKLPYEYFIVLLISAFARYAAAPPVFAHLLKYKRKEYLFFAALVAGAVGLFFMKTMFVNFYFTIIIFIASLFLVNKRWPFLFIVLMIGLVNPPYGWDKTGANKLTARNFFGVLRIAENTDKNIRLLTNGTTTHGSQSLSPNHARTPLSYYYPGGTAGKIFAALDSFPAPQRVAALGLGVGSIACFDHPGRSFDFYEINPDVIAITENPEYFTYLRDCGSPYRILRGDARQEISHAPDGTYDLIFVDVFSSDNIPVHVMTKEAVEIYRRKLKPGGMISIHVSNRFFSLEPEVAAIGKSLGLTTLVKWNDMGPVLGTKIQYYASVYTILSDNAVLLESLRKDGWGEPIIPKDMKPWTDDYADIVRALNPL